MGNEKRASEAEILGLWQRYRASGDQGLRDRLVLTLAPMVKYIVYRKVRAIPAHCDVEDFISCGLEALIRSIERYDPDRGATLEQFAWTRIQGAVLDELRRADWAPRSVRRWERDIAAASERFVAANGRWPTRAELAAGLHTTIEELGSHLGDIAVADVSSLNVPAAFGDDVEGERIDALSDLGPTSHEHCERTEARERIRELVSRLPERERQVAVLLYGEGCTLREIGTVLGVTESRVCQIHTQLRRRLRTALERDAEPVYGAA